MEGFSKRQGAGALQWLFLIIGVEDTLEGIERLALCGSRAKVLPEINDRVLDVADALRKRGAGGVGMAAALEAFGDFQRFAIAAAKAGDDQAAGAAEQR